MKGSFYGWYLKCQTGTHTLAVIPAVHRSGHKSTCSIQIITDDDAWTVDFPIEEYKRVRKNIRIGRNRFGAGGIRLSVHTSKLSVKGKLDFGPLTPLRYDIMGPFALVPFLECRHSIWSMRHTVSGTVFINGQRYAFQNAWGYWEGDRGRSFPKEYLWTQCSFRGGSLMLSVADIPIAGTHFTGIIGVVIWKGKEYRLATYLGAKVVENRKGRIRIIQGELEFEACLLEPKKHPLKAPTKGDMVRTIYESASGRSFYQLKKGGRTLFAFESNQASFEYEYR